MLFDTGAMPAHFPAIPSPSPSATSSRSSRHVPLLSLAPPALALGDDLAVGEPGEENNVGEIWNVITRAADLVKDGERLENLAWRHWGQPRRINSHRRLSSSSQDSASSAIIQTPTDSAYLYRAERRTFGGALSLLVERNEGTFKDWVEDAKKALPPTPLPTLSVPETPVTNSVEIRLVEPTPVPSRAGSFGGSVNVSPLPTRGMPPVLKEETEEFDDREEDSSKAKKARPAPAPIETHRAPPGANKKKGKFFVQSSPGKGSASDSPGPSPTATKCSPPSTSPQSGVLPQSPIEHSTAHAKKKDSVHGQSTHGQSAHGRRHVSLTTLRGKFQSEKRKTADQIAKKHEENAEEEESGWEDDDESVKDEEVKGEKVDQNDEDWEEDEDGNEEDWEEDDDDDDEEQEQESEGQEKVDDGQKAKMSEDEDDWSDEDDANGEALVEEADESQPEETDSRPSRLATDNPAADPNRRRSSSRPRSARAGDSVAPPSRSKSFCVTQTINPPRQALPPPAPAPMLMRKLSKKERQAVAAERARIEARLDAQRKREMFAKKQIFGAQAPGGLLASALQRGASMVDLPSAIESSDNISALRPSPTHSHLTSLAQSPSRPVPSLLRSKSAVAMPVQTGVSVTIQSGHLSKAAGKRAGSHESQRAPTKAELETSDEESDSDANYLATTHTRQKLAELDSKQEAKSKANAAHIELGKAAAHTQQIGQAQAMPVGPRLNTSGVVEPMTPTTRRRNIIMAEMSESLRKNVVLEREKSSGGLTRMLSNVSARNGSTSPIHPSQSAVNLTQYNQGGVSLERTGSHPGRSSTNVSSHTHSQSLASGIPPTMPERRRPAPNVLGGGNILRPLTRVGLEDGSAINRTQSSGVLDTGTRQNADEGAVPQPQAPTMVRHATDGEGTRREKERKDWKKVNLMDTSYRIHGW